VKNISTYAGARLASAEARRAGYDECLLVSGDGVVSEAPTSAVFAARRGTLVTPRLVDDVLPSITRAWVLAVAPKLGIAAAADELEAAALRQADEAFLCGTGIEFGPVAEVDDAVLGGCPGPVTRALVDEYFRQARGEAPVTRVEWQQG
jgi:branched-chain amino acid aminotransferase